MRALKNFFFVSANDLQTGRYRWWTLGWWFDWAAPTVKLGPVSLTTYVWSGDRRRRVSFTWLGGAEHILAGGPLT